MTATRSLFCKSCFGGDDVETTARFCKSCFGGDVEVQARFCKSCFGGDDAETTARFCKSCFGGDAETQSRFCKSCFGGDVLARVKCDCSNGDMSSNDHYGLGSKWAVLKQYLARSYSLLSIAHIIGKDVEACECAVAQDQEDPHSEIAASVANTVIREPTDHYAGVSWTSDYNTVDNAGIDQTSRAVTNVVNRGDAPYKQRDEFSGDPLFEKMGGSLGRFK